MTVVLMICAVPRQGSPFVMIAADSLATSAEDNSKNENAKKIFDAGNALMSTSGNVDDEYREELARVLKENTDGSLADKLQALEEILVPDKINYDLQLNVGLVQFDILGNPQLGFYGVNPQRADRKYGPETYDKNIPMVNKMFFGNTEKQEVKDLVDELEEKLVAGKVNKTSVEDAAKWFIRKVSKINPESVNGIVQTKILRFKSI